MFSIHTLSPLTASTAHHRISTKRSKPSQRFPGPSHNSLLERAGKGRTILYNPTHNPTTIKSSIEPNPNSKSQNGSWLSPGWLISLTKSLLSITPFDNSNIPIANAQLKDVSDSLGGAMFLPLFKWMNDYGPIYRLVVGPRNFVIVSDPVIAKHVLRNYGTIYAKGLLSEVSEYFFGSGFIIAEDALWTVRFRLFNSCKGCAFCAYA